MANNTMKEKQMMFFDMQEHPEKYDKTQIEELLADNDIKAFIHDMAMTKRAILKKNYKNVDVDKEWNEFAYQHNIHHKNRIKVAMSTIIVTLISGMALATIIHLSSFKQPKRKKLDVTTVNNIQNTTKSVLKTKSTTPHDTISNKTVVFENTELASILKQMADYYHKDLIFNNDNSRHLRLYFNWNKKEDLQQNIKLLNGFSRINITCTDNTITVE